MSGQTYDVVTIGGGLAASSLASGMAEKGFAPWCSSARRNLGTAYGENLLFRGEWVKRASWVYMIS
jgi:hypothetical protein